ncbi:ROK family transcriptional regulator [Microbacterium awajiense]|uniref:ROK family transcriptional regulator n=1 Tax=Microbacterium awajiense TaxID=415214 RepID=A0ABP7AJS2_9MICO
MGETTTGATEGRRRNLARLLRLVHVDGPLSRASLTEATGLNRSTIADLVGELARDGLVVERAPDPSRRVGRPSPLVVASADVVAVAVNPEVDAVTIGAVALDRGIRARERIEVDHLVTSEEVSELVADTVRRWRRSMLRGCQVVGVGLAVPGLVRAADGLVRNAPHLLWRDTPLRELVESATSLPATVGNDASLGALAEHLFGAARGVDDVVYLNGGASGIGGGVIVHGMPVTGAGGYAGEFGQNRPGIASEGDRRVEHGVLEDEVSRARLLRAVGLEHADEPTLAEALATSDDPSAADEVARQRRILSTALANAVNVLNPSVVILGGFLATLASPDLPGLSAEVAAQAMGASAEGLDIRVASLGEDRLLMGAAESVFAALIADPAV